MSLLFLTVAFIERRYVLQFCMLAAEGDDVYCCPNSITATSLSCICDTLYSRNMSYRTDIVKKSCKPKTPMFVCISNQQNLWEWRNLMLFNKSSAIFSLKLLQVAEFVYG